MRTKLKNIVEFAFRSLIFIGLLLMILFFLYWLPILEWFCKFKAWC